MARPEPRGATWRPLDAPALTPSALPWWEALPEDFCRRRERFEATGLRRLEVLATAALDHVVSTATATAFAVVLSPALRRGQAARMLDDIQFYAQDRFLADPSLFFHAPHDVTVKRSPARAIVNAPLKANVEELTFEGAFDPVSPRARDRYLAHAENRVSHARHFFHGDRPRPTIIALHGFWASPYWANQIIFEIPWLYRIGLDVVLATMPFHGTRRMRGALFSGHGMLSPYIDQMNEAIAHAVSDVRVLMRHLRARGVEHVGVTGMSLGGYVTALLASIEPRLAFAIPNVPVASLVDLILGWHPLGELMRLVLRKAGMRVADARRSVAVHHALSYRPALPRDRLMVIAGAGDRMAPPSQARLLADHWGDPRTYYFPGNHLLHFDRGGYLRMMARFLASLGMLPPR